MKIEVKIPEVGESVQEALLAQWLKKDGDMVQKDEILFVIETDKVTLEVSSPADGVLRIMVKEDTTVSVGTLVAVIDTAAAGKAPDEASKPAPRSDGGEEARPSPAEVEQKPSEKERPSGPQGPAVAAGEEKTSEERPPKQPGASAPAGSAAEVEPIVSRGVRSLAEQKGVDLGAVAPSGPGGRITEGDVHLFLEQRPEGETPREPVPPSARSGTPVQDGRTVRKPMSPIRQRIAARLLDARRNTAMLTTFNEIDMTRVQELRKRYGEEFKKKHGVRLGIMSFFLKASVTALKEQPEVNAFIEGNEIVYHDYVNIGVAIGAERGLVVPVIRDVETLGFPDLERAVMGFVEKITKNRLSLSDLEGGTFTITNGGVYGSLLSTPILNPPQSAILGMHKIEDRPVVVDGQIAVRPMMYVALSYDHRIVDGREAVGFLGKIKDLVENPERMMMEI